MKLDDSHYFFSFRALKERGSDSDSSDEEDRKKNGLDDYLSYGLTIVSKGQEGLLKKLDGILQNYSSFTMQKVSESAKKVEILDESLAKEMSPADLKTEKKKKEEMEGKCAAYWTTLAPNVEDYNRTAAKLIAAGSGQLIKGILWCGDVTVERLKQGNEVMQKRMGPCSNTEISPETLERIKRFFPFKLNLFSCTHFCVHSIWFELTGSYYCWQLCITLFIEEVMSSSHSNRLRFNILLGFVTIKCSLLHENSR